jgi:hypothetical protein
MCATGCACCGWRYCVRSACPPGVATGTANEGATSWLDCPIFFPVTLATKEIASRHTVDLFRVAVFVPCVHHTATTEERCEARASTLGTIEGRHIMLVVPLGQPPPLSPVTLWQDHPDTRDKWASGHRRGRRPGGCLWGYSARPPPRRTWRRDISPVPVSYSHAPQ